MTDYVDRPFAERPYGRIRLNEPSAYDLYEVVSEWLDDAYSRIGQLLPHKTTDPNAAAEIARIRRRQKRIKNIQQSLEMLAEEKSWNIPV